jgi:hypothetical protein
MSATPATAAAQWLRVPLPACVPICALEPASLAECAAAQRAADASRDDERRRRAAHYERATSSAAVAYGKQQSAADAV